MQLDPSAAPQATGATGATPRAFEPSIRERRGRRSIGILPPPPVTRERGFCTLRAPPHRSTLHGGHEGQAPWRSMSEYAKSGRATGCRWPRRAWRPRQAALDRTPWPRPECGRSRLAASCPHASSRRWPTPREVAEASVRIPGLTVVALAPNVRGAQGAYAAGVHRISVPSRSARAIAAPISTAPRPSRWPRSGGWSPGSNAQPRQMPVIAACSTAFGCSIDGRVPTASRGRRWPKASSKPAPTP